VTVQHSALTGSELHEPKGAASATSGTVYTSDGSGSGSWIDPLTEVKNLNTFCFSGVIDDISTANSNVYFVVPRTCDLVSIKTVIYSAITVADATIEIYRNGILQGQSITIANSGSGAGITDSLALSPVYSFIEGDTIELRSNGGSTDVCKLATTLCFTAT